jgi:cytochrome c oxidase cbb3-type subunit 1
MASMPPYYMLRLFAGLIFLSGTVLMAYNLFKTISGAKMIQVRPPAVRDAGESP